MASDLDQIRALREIAKKNRKEAARLQSEAAHADRDANKMWRKIRREEPDALSCTTTTRTEPPRAQSAEANRGRG